MKKIDISNEIKTGVKYWINIIDNLCQHVFTPNLNIVIYTDGTLPGLGMADTIYSCRGLCYQSEMNHINMLEYLKSGSVALETFLLIWNNCYFYIYPFLVFR